MHNHAFLAHLYKPLSFFILTRVAQDLCAPRREFSAIPGELLSKISMLEKWLHFTLQYMHLQCTVYLPKKVG